MDIQISLGDLGIILLGSALLVLMIYAIFILKNLNDTMKVVRKILQDNESNINKVLDQAPSIAENVESISSDLSRDVKAVQGTFDHIVGTTQEAAAALADNTNVLSSILGVIQLIHSLKEIFRPKRRWF